MTVAGPTGRCGPIGLAPSGAESQARPPFQHHASLADVCKLPLPQAPVRAAVVYPVGATNEPGIEPFTRPGDRAHPGNLTEGHRRSSTESDVKRAQSDVRVMRPLGSWPDVPATPGECWKYVR
jgi:hypothetical protein